MLKKSCEKEKLREERIVDKTIYERHRKTIKLCLETGLTGSDEWIASLKYFRVLKCRGKLPYTPCEENGFLVPPYAETVRYNKEENPRKPRRLQNKITIKEAMREAGIAEEKIEEVFNILEEKTKERANI